MFPLLHMSQTRHCRDHHLDQQAHNRKVQRKVYYPYEKSPHKVKNNQKKKKKTKHIQTNQKKIIEKPILLKKNTHTKKTHTKKLNNNNTYKQINRIGQSNNRTCLLILTLFQPNTNRKIIL